MPEQHPLQLIWLASGSPDSDRAAYPSSPTEHTTVPMAVGHLSLAASKVGQVVRGEVAAVVVQIVLSTAGAYFNGAAVGTTGTVVVAGTTASCGCL